MAAHPQRWHPYYVARLAAAVCTLATIVIILIAR